MTDRAELLISDYAGHAFTYEIAVALNRDHTSTAYSFCSTVVSPKGRVSEAGCRTFPVSSGGSFEKYNIRRRVISELRYGLGTARVVWRTRPQVHIVCNMPLVSMLVIWIATIPLRTKLILWFQDVQSGLAGGILGEGLLTRVISALESFLLRRARRVIAISPELRDEAERRGVRMDRLAVIENWAPIESLDVRPKSNEWSRDHQADTTMTFLYSGTLARKHNPAVLVDLARAVKSSGAQVLVVSEGEGADWLQLEKASDPELDNLTLLPYQPFDQLPDVLGSADVLLVLLEPHAGKFSVPSKTLSYLCAGRPILAAMPLDNTAAHMIRDRAAAGVVVGPDESDKFCAEALLLAADPDRRAELGRAGRGYAEQHFAESVIMDQFVDQLRRAQLN